MSRTDFEHLLRPVARLALVLTAGLLAGNTAAQNLHEILGGSIGDIQTDDFECGKSREGGDKPCGLAYRYYCVDVPEEINSPALPVSGNPAFKPRKMLYLADLAHTGNFPKAGILGPGHVWHLVWDGVKNADTPQHAGYYAAIAQVVEHGEMGNPTSRTCLPVTGQYACFGSIGGANSHLIQNTPMGNINPVGGLSPLPAPLLAQNGTDSITLVWEQATGQVSRDGAPLPIEGYSLYLFPNPVAPPTEKELGEGAVRMEKKLPVTTTSLEIPRSDPALAGAVTVSAALKVIYRGGVESAYFSANGHATGMTLPDSSATGDEDDATAGAGGVARGIDIENLFMEIREAGPAGKKGEKTLYATVDIIGAPAGIPQPGTTVRVHLDFNDEGLAETFAEPGKPGTQDISLQAVLGPGGSGPLRAEFTGLPGLTGSIDSTHGRVTFMAPMKAILAAAGNERLRSSDMGGSSRRLLVWAETTREKDTDRVPNTDDGGAPTVAGEVMKFTFFLD